MCYVFMYAHACFHAFKISLCSEMFSYFSIFCYFSTVSKFHFLICFGFLYYAIIHHLRSKPYLPKRFTPTVAGIKVNQLWKGKPTVERD
jgi:hypothetical protein